MRPSRRTSGVGWGAEQGRIRECHADLHLSDVVAALFLLGVIVFNNQSWEMLRVFQPESAFNNLPN